MTAAPFFRVLFLSLLLGLLVPVESNGNACLICGLIVTAIENFGTLHSQPIDKVMDQLCDWMPVELEPSCLYFVNSYGIDIIEALERGEDPVMVCQDITICETTCTPFPNSTVEPRKTFLNMKNVQEYPWDWIINTVSQVFSTHLPLIDADNDTFSTIEILRGSNWRGRDCDDTNKEVYPGRRSPPSNDPNLDYNCNGIYGLVPDSHQTYEEVFCDGTRSMGVAVLGGSACSHFEISPKWVVAKLINESSYEDLLPAIMNELDWPHRSWSTGYQDSVVNSVYLQMRDMNLCNHRDYQNIGLNGASSNTIVETIHTFSRDQQNDNPMLVFYNPLGDDVCNMDHDDTVAKMTTVDQFRKNVLYAMNYLDGILPAGSHVVFIGLVDGRVLWNHLHDLPHPVFQPIFNITYREVYDWLLCLRSNPCIGWLNSNDSLRNITSERAADLSNVYTEIVANFTFKNFDMVYYPFPLVQIAEAYVKSGRPITDLIEPIDGFHPSQIMNSLLGSYYFDLLADEHPEFLGSINPNNANISRTFGDQGGY